MAKLSLSEARQFVDQLSDISGARTPVSRALAARRASLEQRGVRTRSFEIDEQTLADMARLRRRTGMTNRQLLRAAIAGMCLDEGDGMSPAGSDALARLCTINAATTGEVIDFCVRFTLQELISRRRITIV